MHAGVYGSGGGRGRVAAIGRNHAELDQQTVEVGPLDLLDSLVQGELFEGIHLHVGDGLAVPDQRGGVQQIADVERAAPYFGHAAVDVAQRVDGFHAGAHGILGGENGVARRFRELSDEREVHRAFGHDVGSVACGARHEECRDVGHHARNRVGAVLGELLDLRFGNAQVVQPFHADLLAGACAQGLFHVVAGHVGEQTVYPAAQLVAGLGAELGLPVERPA